jgi:hypothetical protein
MAYSPDYNSTDLGPIAIDGIGTVGATMVGLAALIGLIMVYRLLKGQGIGI